MNAFWSTLTGRSNTPEPSSPMSATSRPTRRKSSASPKQPKPDFSFGGLQTLLDELISITGDADTPSSIVGTSPDHLVELIRAIAETLLWAEQNQDDSSMFDHFCERGIIKVFVNLLNAPTIMSAPTSGLSIFTSPSASTMISSNRQIKVQLLQTMSLLVLNIKRDTSLYFLFSNNAINQLINNNNNLDFSDEEILSYYVTFMKSIALRISADSVKLFMNERSSNYFPLFIQSIRFFDHHDRMIRTAVRTITLCIFKLYPANENLGKFLRENTGGYFSLLASQLRDLWLLIDRTLEDLKVVPIASIESGLSVIIDELIDQLEYIADINRLEIPEDLKILLQDQLKAYAIDPVLIPSLIGSDKPEETGGDKLSLSPKLALKTAYFVTTFLVNIFTNSSTMMDKLVYQKIFNSAQFKSQIIVVLKTCEMPTLMPLIIFLTSLARNVTSESTPGWREFGLVPPESIELSILITQTLSRAIDKLNLVSVQLILDFLKNHIFALSSTYPEFIKPIHLTLSDALRSVASRVVAIMNNSVLITPTKLSSSPTVSSNAPDFDYSLIDDFEKILLEFVVPNTSVLDEQVLFSPRLLMDSSRSSSDVSKKDCIGDEWTVSDPSVLLDNAGGGDGKLIFRKFFCLAVYEKKIETSTLEKIFFEIFVTNDSSEDVTEGSILDLSEKDRILCTHISSNRSTRYLIIDPSRLMLVTPDITKPGFAVVKFAILLRSIKSMSVDKQDERILRLTISSTSSSSSSSFIELGFEDAKRSYLALTHLETRRVEIRKDIFTKIRKYISDFSR